MHPRTDEVLSHLDHYRVVLREAVEEVPADRREERPAPDRWSVAEILEHVGIVEGGITRLLQKQLDEVRAGGLGPEQGSSPVVPTVPVSLIVDRSSRIEANPRVLPTSGLTAEAAWKVLEERRKALREFLIAVDGLALGDIVIPVPHPRLGPLNGWQWLVFLGAHEGRHAGQIRELVQAGTTAQSP